MEAVPVLQVLDRVDHAEVLNRVMIEGWVLAANPELGSSIFRSADVRLARLGKEFSHALSFEAKFRAWFP
jgi:hypothetical protein